MTRCLRFMILAFVPLFANAQSLRGTVVDTSGRPLRDATLRLLGDTIRYSWPRTRTARPRAPVATISPIASAPPRCATLVAPAFTTLTIGPLRRTQTRAMKPPMANR